LMYFAYLYGKREPTSGLEPLTPASATSDNSGVAGGCTELQIPHIYAGFLCSGLQCVAFPVV
jgi:hypothetical protein